VGKPRGEAMLLSHAAMVENVLGRLDIPRNPSA